MHALPWRRRRRRARWVLVWLAVVGTTAGWADAPAQTAPPQNVTAPAVTGIAVVGQTLTANPGRWAGSAPIAFAYAWERCSPDGSACAPIAGAVGQTYQLNADDAGAAVRVQVTASNAAAAAAIPSGTTGVIAATPPVDAVQLPGGDLSLPVTDIAAPDRLLLASVRYLPAKPLAGHPLQVIVHVRDAAGYSIAGALVTATGLPYGLYTGSPQSASDTQGVASLTLQPTPLTSLQAGLTPALLVRADLPGATAPTALSAQTVLQLQLAAAPARKSVASPYSAGARGYDLSYPDCRRPRAPQLEFAILGVNGGRPFTFNPCLEREYALYGGVGPQAVYLNTGYDPKRFRRRITPACALARGAPRSPGVQAAYAAGCSEAAASLERITLLGLPLPTHWWLDVETSNSWSSNRTLNVAVLRGMIDFLDKLTPAPVVGIYSQRSWWRAITGGWATANPEWVPSPTGVCPTAFSTGPVWLAQTGSAVHDLDSAC
jgi:hypothetical protein